MLLVAWGTSLALAFLFAPVAKAGEPADGQNQHRSLLVIGAHTRLPASRSVTIGMHKSLLVEFPVPLTNVLVSNPDVLDAAVQTANQVYLLAKDVGEANAIFIGPDGRKLLFLEVSISQDLSLLSDSLSRLIPGSDIKVEMVGENIVLSGSVIDPVDANRAADLAAKFSRRAGKVVNLIKAQAKEQVLLRVKVAEMARDAIRRIGVDLPQVALQAGNFSFAKVITNSFPVTGAAVPSAIYRGAGTVPFVGAGTAFQPGFAKGNQSINALIQMLEQRGIVRTLAEPNLVAMSGEVAEFHAGGKVPYLEAQPNGVTTIKFEDFGVRISFKPVVLSTGRISLKVRAEVSDIDNKIAARSNGNVVPGISTREASTTLELPSGGTIAMAGLLSDDTRQSVEGVPGLKSVPMLGALFRSNDYRRRETELVILVTPTIARHAARQEFGDPGQGYAPTSELKELIFGHLNRIYGRGGPLPPGGYKGDYGFIIDYPDRAPDPGPGGLKG